MKAGWSPKNSPGRLFHVVEECGEVCQAIGKLGRFGAHNKRPGKTVTNAEHLRDELLDLRAAIKESLKDIEELIKAGKQEKKNETSRRKPKKRAKNPSTEST